MWANQVYFRLRGCRGLESIGGIRSSVKDCWEDLQLDLLHIISVSPALNQVPMDLMCSTCNHFMRFNLTGYWYVGLNPKKKLVIRMSRERMSQNIALDIPISYYTPKWCIFPFFQPCRHLVNFFNQRVIDQISLSIGSIRCHPFPPYKSSLQ